MVASRLVLLTLALSGSAVAQRPVGPPLHVAWPLIDFLVLGDSGHGVQLLAAPNLQTQQGRDQLQFVSIMLSPASTRLWSMGVGALIDSVDKVPPAQRAAFVTLALTGNRRRAWLRISLGDSTTPATPYDVEVFDSTGFAHPAGPVTWTVPASASQVMSLLTTLDAVAEQSALDSTPGAGNAPVTYPVIQLDQWPTLKQQPDIPYPQTALENRRDGRVWVQFVVDTSGTVRPEVRILMSDGEEFTQAVLAAVPTLRYTPGMRRGRPVTSLVHAPFLFNLEGKRVIVPFTIAH